MFKVMSKKEILDIVNISKASNPLYKNSTKDPQGWMFRKTVIKQLSKTLPKDYYGKKGISVDDKVEGGGYLKLDEDNNVMFVDGKKIIPKRNKSIYANLELEPMDDRTPTTWQDEVFEKHKDEPLAKVFKKEKNIPENKNNSLSLDL